MLDELAPIAARIAEMLKERGQTIAVIDGATGGLVSAALLTVPGATKFYVGGGVVYSFKGRALLLGMTGEELSGQKSVTEPYALLQARQVAATFGADWGVAESGSAGPGRHPQGVPSGTSAIAVHGPGASITKTISTGNEDDRIANMWAFSRAALELLEDTMREVGQSGGR